MFTTPSFTPIFIIPVDEFVTELFIVPDFTFIVPVELLLTGTLYSPPSIFISPLSEFVTSLNELLRFFTVVFVKFIIPVPVFIVLLVRIELVTSTVPKLYIEFIGLDVISIFSILAIASFALYKYDPELYGLPVVSSAHISIVPPYIFAFPLFDIKYFHFQSLPVNL